jgi:hypothetical protein
MPIDQLYVFYDIVTDELEVTANAKYVVEVNLERCKQDVEELLPHEILDPDFKDDLGGDSDGEFRSSKKIWDRKKKFHVSRKKVEPPTQIEEFQFENIDHVNVYYDNVISNTKSVCDKMITEFKESQAEYKQLLEIQNR